MYSVNLPRLPKLFQITDVESLQIIMLDMQNVYKIMIYFISFIPKHAFYTIVFHQ